MNHLTTVIDKAQVTSLCADAISELERAARLHPKWPGALLLDTEERVGKKLLEARVANGSHQVSGHTVFCEEYLEFLEASFKPGNHVAARIELVQALAMLLRIGCHLEDYVGQGADHN